ncbi:hypothetical protein [Candidatus Contubernalis alkaliaceticus]|uniref:hypothetical protein n=1 Tax=Candidatus Contubernalis alkaliaceticus TaxID=338645 RepID=UPI001F4C4D8A|nr:hypothetical protein [Candidatus Contubernalis alkalaceticus]UNC91895.1 hypothetical protein HUE98_07160 [Candidatus Contubernalis alkalaceticus]
MKIIKILFFYLVICGVLSGLIYYFTENIVFAASIWVVYGAGLVLGKITELIFSIIFSPLHGNAFASIMVFLSVGLLVGTVDFYFMVPVIQGAVEYPLPLSFSVPLFIVYGVFLFFYLIIYYIRNRTCPSCKGITLRKGGFCHLCGFSGKYSKGGQEKAPYVQSRMESAAALENQEEQKDYQQEVQGETSQQTVPQDEETQIFGGDNIG